MPVIQLEVQYLVQYFVKGSWTDYTEPVASLRGAIRDYEKLAERYTEDSLRIVKQTLRRETVEWE